MDRFVPVNMRDFLEQPAGFHLDSQFLTQFTDQALLEGFAGFTLATRKFPKSAQM